MPIEIPVEMSQSKSTVPAMPVNGKSTVPAKTGCGAGDKRLEQLIKIEKEERIEADENLQRQIDNVNIRFIYITQVPDGTLNESDLELLRKNKVNRLVIDSNIYYLSIINGNIRKYFTRAEQKTSNEIQVDMDTGSYHVTWKNDPALEEHINDKIVHITAGERLFWNNKVSATKEKIQPMISNPEYEEVELKLTTEDIYNNLEDDESVEGE